MTLFKLKSATTILIEEDNNKNCLPLLYELVKDDNNVNIFCFDQPVSAWQGIFMNKHINCYKEVPTNFVTLKENTTLIIDSVNQMALTVGWNKCLKQLRDFQLNLNVTKLVLILHKDCILLNSKLQINLIHMTHAIVSFYPKHNNKLSIQIKKAGKFIKSDETYCYDSKIGCVKLTPIVKLSKKDEVEKVAPANLTTFKIETDQISQLEKNKLKLPYMSKINEGQGRVFYEPDAVDDWDDEDPDDDLDI
ncbi:unnamed protein product [Pieris macdunnoughi]|uniref:Elongator complex protein 5 n=1 Tax=Pieris macdunnoughi TaxID=345717 RepID=A0A821U5V8_9NEOP|nr:unnamed protein product [Pieris macdunnoughi]